MSKYLCFDTETTGLHNNSQILTAYFIILDSNFREIDYLDLNIKYPIYNLQLKAFQVNKINLAIHERKAIDPLDAKIKFDKFIFKHYSKQKLIPLGHNVKFDLEQLFKSECNFCMDYIGSTFSIDTMQIAYFLKCCGEIPLSQSLSLKNITDYYKIKYDGQLHNAECDIKLTIKLFKYFKENYKIQTIQKQEQKEQEQQDRLDSWQSKWDRAISAKENYEKQQDTIDDIAKILLTLKSTRKLRDRKIIKYY
jgi:DNA polymerase III epsilon subunit-like protein